jgi:hypothetical protein
MEVQSEEKNFIDLDSHVDIHKPNEIVPVHIFNC